MQGVEQLQIGMLTLPRWCGRHSAMRCYWLSVICTPKNASFNAKSQLVLTRPKTFRF
jgi:hypothetical protein